MCATCTVTVKRAGLSYLKSGFEASGPLNLNYQVCLDITGLDGFEDATGAVPSTLIAGSLQAAFLAWYTAAGPEAAQACPQIYDKATGKIDLAAVQTDVMHACRKVSDTGVSYGLRFTAYFPCTTAQGRYEVLDATVFQPGPTHAAAFGPTEVYSQPPTSTERIGWGADVGISARLRLTAEFTRASFVQATDIAVDPSDPSNVWIVGPVNESAVNPACGKPYGGPLLKWGWATSSFQPVAGIKAAGVRVTIMPETHMPWVVDGCGQLRGWSRSLKNLYGPAPHGQLYDVAAVNATLYSGCSSYNPATFQGNIAAGCWPPINVAVRPNGALYTSEAGDVAVAANGYELLAAGQDVLYKDPSMDRHFRLFRAPDGHQLLRIAAGSDGSVWLVIGQSASAALGAPRATLAGVYRGFAGTPEQPRSADWRTTCGDTHPGCADGGCDAGLTRCLRCAAPQFVMGSNGRCRPLVCTDVNPNCAECGPGAMCITCAPGFVRGYHSGDTLCRRPIKGPVTCWAGAAGESKQQALKLGNNTWQHMATAADTAVFVDTAGIVRTIRDSTLDQASSFTTKGAWRAASRIMGMSSSVAGWYGVTNAGVLGFANETGTIVPPPLMQRWPDLRSARVLAVATDYFWRPGHCVVTSGMLGRCISGDPSEFVFSYFSREQVHAACIAAADLFCFLDIYGEIHCKAPSRTLTPPEGELWVEIICGSSSVCARTASGTLHCFFLGNNPQQWPVQLSGRYSSLAAYHAPYFAEPSSTLLPRANSRQRVCGIDTAHRLQCMFAWKDPGSSQEFSKLVTLEPTRAWAAVAVTYDSVCAIPAN
ncbi:hypothetical protein COHA_005767 [Chlorella ohadii]|uniref:Uncharacterized protein n=1 Tax=Chlorella ohadii TaxID=2649997 RepID=A0AAD5DR41_9CHLO|nr:hypothetical protein COHA_005767 [Chlorella ohadii]